MNSWPENNVKKFIHSPHTVVHTRRNLEFEFFVSLFFFVGGFFLAFSSPIEIKWWTRLTVLSIRSWVGWCRQQKKKSREWREVGQRFRMRPMSWEEWFAVEIQLPNHTQTMCKTFWTRFLNPLSPPPFRLLQLRRLRNSENDWKRCAIRCRLKSVHGSPNPKKVYNFRNSRAMCASLCQCNLSDRATIERSKQ